MFRMQEWLQAVLGTGQPETRLSAPGAWLSTTAGGPLAISGAGIAGKDVFRRRGPALFIAGPQPTWALVMVTPDGTREVLDPLTQGLEGTSKVTRKGLTMRWDTFCAPGGGTIAVSCTWVADSTQPLFYGRIRVDNNSACAIKEVQFPVLTLAATPASADEIMLVFPRDYGRSWRNPFKAPLGYLVGTHETEKGDGGHWQPEMQFATLVDTAGRGLYWAAYDGEIYPKRFVIDNPADSTTIRVHIGQVPRDAPKGGVDYESPYPIVLGTYLGDWWDAAHLYRSWAVKQKWCNRGPLKGRTDIPEVVKETDIWLRGDGRHDDPHGELRYTKEILGILGGPIGIQYYNWSLPKGDPKDNDNWCDPLRWPTRSWFSEHVNELKRLSNGCRSRESTRVLVTPYLNSLQWDKQCPSWPGEQEARALTDFNGKPVSGIDGSCDEPLKICAASPVFRDALVKTSKDLVKEAGVAGIYLDQLGRQCGFPCYSPQHGHPVAAGPFGADGVRETCRAIRQAIREVNRWAFVSGETPSECLLDAIDLRLAAYNLWPYWVNLWPAVYGDRALTFGRTIQWTGDYGSGDSFYASCGNTFVSGRQFGRLAPTSKEEDMLCHPNQVDVRKYLKELVALRRAARKFLTYGWLQRPVHFLSSVPDLDAVYRIAKHSDGKREVLWTPIAAVLATAWAAHDGTLGFVFTNISADWQTVRWQADLSRHEIERASRYGLTLVRADVHREPAVIVRESTGILRGALLEREERLPPRSAFVLEVSRLEPSWNQAPKQSSIHALRRASDERTAGHRSTTSAFWNPCRIVATALGDGIASFAVIDLSRPIGQEPHGADA